MFFQFSAIACLILYCCGKVEINKELQTELKTHGTKIDGAQFFMQLQKEDND